MAIQKLLEPDPLTVKYDKECVTTVPEEKLAQLILLVAGEVGDDQAHLVIHHHHPQPEHLHKEPTNKTDLVYFRDKTLQGWAG